MWVPALRPARFPMNSLSPPIRVTAAPPKTPTRFTWNQVSSSTEQFFTKSEELRADICRYCNVYANTPLEVNVRVNVHQKTNYASRPSRATTIAYPRVAPNGNKSLFHAAHAKGPLVRKGLPGQ